MRHDTTKAMRDHLAELAEMLRRPHHDDAERRRRQEAARHAAANPRRQGKGLHPGSH